MAAPMNPTVRNILAIIAGLVIGSIVNMAIIMLFTSVVPAPEGVDVKDVASIKANIDKYEWKHFIGPFLAHALGTLVGAFVASKFSASRHNQLAYIVGLIFLFGGAYTIYQIGGPTWFAITDLLFAYIPMAFIGFKLSGKPMTNLQSQP